MSIASKLAPPAYAHLVPLKDDELLTIAGIDFDTEFKLEDARISSEAKGEDCRRL